MTVQVLCMSQYVILLERHVQIMLQMRQITFSKWGSGEPNSGQDACLHMTSSDGYWHDRKSCSNGGGFPLCKRPVGQRVTSMATLSEIRNTDVC